MPVRELIRHEVPLSADLLHKSPAGNDRPGLIRPVRYRQWRWFIVPQRFLGLRLQLAVDPVDPLVSCQPLQSVRSLFVFIAQHRTVAIAVSLFWNVRQASAMLTRLCAAAFMSLLSILRIDCQAMDGLDAFPQSSLQKVILHVHLSIHLPEAAVLFGHVLHLSDQRRIHAAELHPPFIKLMPCSRHSSETNTPLYTCVKTAMICTSLNHPFITVNLLRDLAEKIQPLNAINFRQDCGRPLSACNNSLIFNWVLED